MTDECDELPEEDWPNDDEANDIMLAYAATDYSHSSTSGCAGLVLLLTPILVILIWTLVC
jgi:hypothetical protein